MDIERKFIDLASFKAEETGPGGFSGYAAIFNEIDEGGDVIVKGAFTDTIEEFLQKGFTAHSHDWSVTGTIGYPVNAYEDDKGFFVESKFHSTADAQTVRTKASERMTAGKQVGLSIGYRAIGPIDIPVEDYEQELPKYIPEAALSRAFERARKFNGIRVLRKIENFEHSIVTAPMNRLAEATSIKGLPDGSTFADHLQSVLDANLEVTRRAKEIQDLRVKEGRTLSGVNRSRLSQLVESLKACSVDIETLLAETDPQKADQSMVASVLAHFEMIKLRDRRLSQ